MKIKSPFIAVLLFLAVVTVLAYLPVFHADFVNFDDVQYVTKNPHVQAGQTAEGFRWAFNVGYAFNWHPLTWMSHMTDVSLFGTGPVGPHAVNFILHMLSILLLFLVLNRMTDSVWKSGVVAALFAVHPMHVESVAWISERKDVLSGLFWMLTMWAYVRYSEAPNIKRYVIVAAFLALGLMSKPTLVTLPVVLLMLDYWPLGRFGDGWRKLIREKLPLFALSAGSSVLTYMAQEKSAAVRTFTETPLAARVANAITSYVGYVVKMIWPAKLAVYYPYSSNIPALIVAGSALLLVLVTALAIISARKRPWLLVGWLWYLVVLLPMIGLVQVGGQAMADRYTYISFIGLFVMVVWEALGSAEVRECGGAGDSRNESRGKKARKRAGKQTQEQGSVRQTESIGSTPLAVSLAVIVVLAGCTWRQVGYWQDSVTLWTHTIAVTTDNDVAHNNLGMEYGKLNRTDEEIEEYKEAIRINPDFGMAYVNLGASLIPLRKYDEAENAFRQAIRVNPNHAKAHFGLGLTRLLMGDKASAEAEYTTLTRLDPAMADKLLRLINR